MKITFLKSGGIQTDAWLAARAKHYDRSVASFDRDLDKFKDIKRVEPVS